MVVKSDCTIWFSDPSYGIDSDYFGHRAPREQDGAHVYRLDPVSKRLDRVIETMQQPNGLAFSANETQLFVVDSARTSRPDLPAHIRRFDITADGTPVDRGVVVEATVGLFDGIRLDDEDRIWAGAGDGVHCYDNDGHLVGKILSRSAGDQPLLRRPEGQHPLYVHAADGAARPCARAWPVCLQDGRPVMTADIIGWTPEGGPHPAPANRLIGRSILVTGAAQGIGRAIARLFAAEGAKLALLDNNEAALASVAKETDGVAVGCDLRDPAQIVAAVEAATLGMGRLDGLVNGAGIHAAGSITETTLEKWREVMAVNLDAPFLLCREAAPHLARRMPLRSSTSPPASACHLLPTGPHTRRPRAG